MTAFLIKALYFKIVIAYEFISFQTTTLCRFESTNLAKIVIRICTACKKIIRKQLIMTCNIERVKSVMRLQVKFPVMLGFVRQISIKFRKQLDTVCLFILGINSFTIVKILKRKWSMKCKLPGNSKIICEIPTVKICLAIYGQTLEKFQISAISAESLMPVVDSGVAFGLMFFLKKYMSIDKNCLIAWL